MKMIYLLISLSGLWSTVMAAIPVELTGQPVAYLNAHVSDSMNLKEQSRETDANQTTHVRLKQYYQGYPVWGGDVLVHYTQEKATTTNGRVYAAIQHDLTLSQATALSQLSEEKAKRQAFLLYQQKRGNQTMPEVVSVSRMIYITPDHQAHWAFKVQLKEEVNGVLTLPVYLLEAVTDKLYQSWDEVKTLSFVSAGGLGGNQKTGQQRYGVGKEGLPAFTIERDANRKICYLKNKTVSVKDSSNHNQLVRFACQTPSAIDGGLYWDGDQDATNGAYSPSNDAFFAGIIVQRLYQEWYHMPVLTQQNKPLMLTLCVHKKMDNAYWDGKQMAFGDGSGLFFPLVSLGIAAHEISHGFTEQHSNLIYTGESGALNESFSDMAAMAAEFYEKGFNTWQIGAEVLKIKDKALRYMDDPTKDCEGALPGDCSISHLKAYKEGLDPHFASGIFNKVFYLIATAPNENTRKAFDLMVQANRFYWQPLTTFKSAACDVIHAAQDLHQEIQIVKNAFSVVGISTNQC